MTMNFLGREASSDLLGKKHSIVDAERTLRSALLAFNHGDKRLAVSRGITAVIQASIASVNAPQEIVERAERVVQGVRKMIQGVVVYQALSGLGAEFRITLPRLYSQSKKVRKRASKPHRAIESQQEIMRKALKSKELFNKLVAEYLTKIPKERERFSERGIPIHPSGMTVDVARQISAGMAPQGTLFVPSDTPMTLWESLTNAISPVDLWVTPNGVFVSERAAPVAIRYLMIKIIQEPLNAATIMRPEFMVSLSKRVMDAVRKDFREKIFSLHMESKLLSPDELVGMKNAALTFLISKFNELSQKWDNAKSIEESQKIKKEMAKTAKEIVKLQSRQEGA